MFYQIDIVGENDVVGIAHRYESALAEAAVGQELLRNVEQGLAHVDSDAVDLLRGVHVQFEGLDPRQGE